MTSTAADLRPRAVEDPSTEQAQKPRRRALIVFPVLLVVAVGGATALILSKRGKESTDDAYVEGHVASVSPRVSGQVLRVLVQDNQAVKAGDVLVELDDRDLAAKLSAAKADLSAAQAQLHANQTQLAVTSAEVDSTLAVAKGGMSQAAAIDGTTRAAIEQAHADVRAAEAQRSLAASELERTQRLLGQGALSQSQFDTRKAGLDQAEAVLAQATARVNSAQANLANSLGTIQTARGHLLSAQSGPERVNAVRAQVELATARVDQAQAALDQAVLNFEYTRIRAGVSGVVARRSVEVGHLVSPDRALMAIVPLDDVWVVANYKEDQIAEIRPGERAAVSIDTFSDLKLTGKVDSLAGGTGARFSLLPPDNASGNFTKVVQRVPVLIRLDPHPGIALRPGMSAVATVYTR
jgi:membrane fusion protein (multidrug efflux system)